MLHASTQKLIVKLCELTEAGHIAWKHGEGRTCSFETEGYVVEIQGQPARLRLLHADGRELERADEIDLVSQPWIEGDATFASQITLLAARADRIARGAEFAISRILSSLSAPPKSVPFAFAPAAQPATAVNADRPPPPAPHTMPGPPPDPVASETAIDRVLAVEPRPASVVERPAPEQPPAPEPEPVIIESETAAVVVAPEAVEEVIEEAAAEPPPSAAPAPEPGPVIIEAETVAIVAESAPAPEPELAEPATTPAPAPASQPVVQDIPRPQQTFGAITSFAKPRDLSAAPRAATPKPFSTSPLFFGVNQMPKESPRAEPEPPPVPAPTAKPLPTPPPVAEQQPAPAVAGPDVYKPWS